MIEENDFKDKVAVITGGAHGIGRQIAVDLAKRGCHTVIADLSEKFGPETAQKITENYCESLFVKADVADANNMVDVRTKTFEKFGRVDILVLDAGLGHKHTFDEITHEEWNHILSVNLTGLFNTVKPFFEDFKTNKGSIVYISSGSALSGTGGEAAYPASKAGGEGLMRALAKELGPCGVTVNAIAPRLIDTGEMMRVNYPTQADLDAVLAKIPMRRFGSVQDVSNLALYLANPSNKYITGQTILLDGGRTIQ